MDARSGHGRRAVQSHCRTLSFTGFIAAGTLFAGCVERTISINTEPAGATVMLNDQDVGRSPVKVPFTWYGDYDIIVRKEGFETVKTSHRLQTPWYQLPGVDFFSECLIPFTIHDDHVIPTIAMDQARRPSQDALLQNAAEMRMDAGVETP